MRNVKNVLMRATLITAVAEFATILMFLAMRMIGAEVIELMDWVETVTIPLVVGLPIAAFVVAQADKLRVANDRLTALNDERTAAHRQLQEAHDMIAFAARHDRMTGLLNREGFLDELSRFHGAMQDGDVPLIVEILKGRRC